MPQNCFALTLHACMLSWFSRVWLFATLWFAVCQAPLSMGFSRQEYWSGLPCPPPGDLPDPGIELVSLTSALAAGFFTTSDTHTMCPQKSYSGTQAARPDTAWTIAGHCARGKDSLRNHALDGQASSWKWFTPHLLMVSFPFSRDHSQVHGDGQESHPTMQLDGQPDMFGEWP